MDSATARLVRSAIRRVMRILPVGRNLALADDAQKMVDDRARALIHQGESPTRWAELQRALDAWAMSVRAAR